MTKYIKQKLPSRKTAILDVHSPIYLKSRNSKYCGGDIGDIYPLVEKASQAGFKCLQFTPIQDTGHNPCPYMGRSIFSYSPIFLSLDHLENKVDFSRIDKGLLSSVEGTRLDHVSYRKLYNFKLQVLRRLFDGEKESELFREEKNYQILAYAVFSALRKKYRSKWVKWPNEFKFGGIKDILKNHPSLHNEVNSYLFSQKILEAQWQDVKNYAEKKGLEFIFDKPIYPMHDSAEVWANKDLFYLKNDGSLKYASGCNNPRDPFGAQYWGHAVYKFKQKPDEVIKYFLDSIEFLSKTASVVRLDHTLALVWKYYIMKPKSDSGKHYQALKHKLFNKLIAKYPDIIFIAEDLGYVSKRNVDESLLKHNIPGMRSPQWCHIPKYSKVNDYPEICLAMTSNHDLESMPRWWHKLRKGRKEILLREFGDGSAGDFYSQVWQMINLVFKSKALFASITLRDLSHDMRRYNKPGIKNSQNWTEQMHLKIEDIDYEKIKKTIKQSNR